MGKIYRPVHVIYSHYKPRAQTTPIFSCFIWKSKANKKSNILEMRLPPIMGENCFMQYEFLTWVPVLIKDTGNQQDHQF